MRTSLSTSSTAAPRHLRQALLAVGGFPHLEPFIFEQAPEGEAHARVVVDHQHPQTRRHDVLPYLSPSPPRGRGSG